MDIISTAILAGVAAGLTKVGERVVVDAYTQIKELIKKKFGSRSKVVKAIKELELNPRSEARKEVVKEEVVAVKADQDQELKQAAEKLLELLGARSNKGAVELNIVGNGNITVAGDGNVIQTKLTKQI